MALGGTFAAAHAIERPSNWVIAVFLAYFAGVVMLALSCDHEWDANTACKIYMPNANAILIASKVIVKLYCVHNRRTDEPKSEANAEADRRWLPCLEPLFAPFGSTPTEGEAKNL